MPIWQAEARVFTGRLDDFDPSAVPLGHGQLRPVVFDRASLSGSDVALDELSLVSAWSNFDECTFHQGPRRLHPDGAEPQGSFGTRPALYSACTFRGIRFRTRAGFAVGHAQFEDCVFDQCRFEEHFSFAADYLRCTFIGPIKTAVFYGTDPYTGRHNELGGNDFRRAVISTNVAWRGDFPLAQQLWPEGYAAVEQDH